MRDVRRIIICFIAFIAFPTIINAAPVWNEPFKFRQPDGSLVNVVVSGDEFYQDVKTPDGYPLIRDPATQWICYAKLSSKGDDWVSTGIVYDPRKAITGRISSKGLQKFARLNSSSILARRKAKFLELNDITYEQSMKEYSDRIRALSKEAEASGSNITPPVTKPDTVYGLTILIDFPDLKSAVPIDSIRNWLNMQGYKGYKNNGSIRDYFYDVSDGKMVYFNECTDFITADNPKTTYDAGTGYGGSTTLMTEITAKLKNMGTFDFSRLTVTNGYIRAVNVLYAGTADAGWANGLWPHSGTFRYTFATGVAMSAHQMSNLGSSLSLGTFCHENGHMLCKWKDLYAYDSHDNGAGGYCIMCSIASATNPQQPNGFMRSLMKWITVIDITNDGLGKLYSHEANGPTIYAWNGTNSGSAQEAYYLEARRKTGRSTYLPDSGILIWHVDKTGDNTDSTKSHYLVPVQADGLFELEKKINSGKPGDLFRAGYKTQFNDNTTPSAKWYNGANSGIQIANVSAVGPTMTFSLGSTVGTVPAPQKNTQPWLSVLRTPGPCIRYSVPKMGDSRIMVRINLYHLNGTLVKTLVNENKQSGQSYTVAINGIETGELKLPQGTYLCTLNAAGVQQAIKILLK
jgi:M6 family metalloprotease-like protein